MKPKHRVFCPYAGRAKMVFETEKKAMRFIEYNAYDFCQDFVPTRAYYCAACGGWHLTHKEKQRLTYHHHKTQRNYATY